METPLSPLSKYDQAFALYFPAGYNDGAGHTLPGIGTAADTFGSIGSIEKPLPNTTIYAESAQELSGYTGNDRCKITVMVKSALAPDADQQLDDPANLHEARSAGIYALLKVDHPASNGMPALCAALNALAPAATFFQIHDKGKERDFLEDAVIDSYILEAICCPSKVN